MNGMIFQKDDTVAANEYFELYMSLRQALREGKIETTDVEDYLDYKEKLLSTAAKRMVQEMVAGVK
jgi:hypothetical protein